MGCNRDENRLSRDFGGSYSLTASAGRGEGRIIAGRGTVNAENAP